MQTLMRAAVASPDSGNPLPSPFPVLEQYGIFHRRGQLSIVAAASGVGKSQYATFTAAHARPAIPTLYFSCDTDVLTMSTRVGAAVLEDKVSNVEAQLRSRSAEVQQRIDMSTNHIWFSWDSQPNTEDIWNETCAYSLVTGAWPHLIVIDNLINVDAEGSAGHEQKDGVLAWLQRLGVRTNAHVMVLQHVVKEFENGYTPIPKSGLLDSVAKRPRLVLTLYKRNEFTLGLRVVKNSNGRMDSNANYGPDLAVNFEKSWMSGQRYESE